MKRDTVYAIVDQERDHQDAKWGTIEAHPHEVGSWILIMESLLADARKAWQSTNGDRDAMGEIRKVVAVGIAAMEAQDCIPTREWEEHRKREAAHLEAEIRRAGL